MTKTIVRIFLFFMVFVLIGTIITTSISFTRPEEEVDTTVSTEPSKELIDEPVLYEDVGYETPLTYWGAVAHQDALLWYIAQLETELDSGLYTQSACEAMIDEINRLKIDISAFDSDINKFLGWMEEYPVATEVWFYLRNQGYSEEVAAGIIGNMMVETTGGNLNLKPYVYSPNKRYYGLCQWSSKYYKKVHGLDVQGQLDYLMNTIKGQFSNYAFLYKKNFTYEKFLNLESPKDVALAFAKIYERCGKGSYPKRKRCAMIAYDYFTREESSK